MKITYISSLLAMSLLTNLNATTLKDTVNQTILTNSEIITNQLKIKSIQKDIDIEKRSFYPTVDLESYIEQSNTKDNNKSAESLNGYNAKLKASQLLYDGGETSSKIKEKEYNYFETNYRYTQENERVVYSIIEAYTNLVKYDELQQIIKYNEKSHKEALNVAYDKEEISGEALETLRTINLIATQEDTKYTLENDLNKAQSKFKSLTSIQNIENICRPQINKELIPSSLDELIQLALNNNYKIKEQQEIVKKQKEILEQRYARYYPEVKLNLSAAYDKDLELNGDGKQREYLGQVLLNWNLYNGGKDTKIYEKERIRLSEENKHLEKITNEVIENITNYYNTYEKAQERVANFDKSIKANIDILALTKDQLEDGTKTFLDVLQTKTRLTDSQSNKIKQEFEVLNNYYKILAELSMLTKNIINGQDQVCKDIKVPDLINNEDTDDENNLDELLDSDSSLNKNEEVAPLEDTTENNNEIETNFIEQLSKYLNEHNIVLNEENSSFTINTTPNSFKRGILNLNSNFKHKLDSISSEVLNIINENKDTIKYVLVEANTSSEYRSVKGLENKFKANLKTSKKRANEVKQYFIEEAISNKLDTSWFNSNMVAVGKGPINLIKDANGKEDIEASRRIILRIIKK